MSKIKTHESGFQKIPLKDRVWCSGYIRVSNQGQADHGLGLDVQRRSIMEYCQRHSLGVHHIYCDVGSGVESALHEREEFWEMIEYARSGGAKVIVVADISRIYRDIGAATQIKKLFRELGIEVISLGQPSYSIHRDDNPSDFLLNQITDALAHFDRLVIVKRLYTARLESVKQGKWAGNGLPYGFSTSKDGLTENKYQMNIVRLAFRLHKKGISYYRISQLFNEKEIPTQKNARWYPRTIRRLIHNRIYKGYLKFGGQFFKSKYGRFI